MNRDAAEIAQLRREKLELEEEGERLLLALRLAEGALQRERDEARRWREALGLVLRSLPGRTARIAQNVQESWDAREWVFVEFDDLVNNCAVVMLRPSKPEEVPS